MKMVKMVNMKLNMVFAFDISSFLSVNDIHSVLIFISNDRIFFSRRSEVTQAFFRPISTL